MKALRCKRNAAMLATTDFWSEAPEGMKRVWGIPAPRDAKCRKVPSD